MTRPSGARWATVATFFANGFGFGAWAAVIAPLKIHLGLSPSALSLALLAIAIGAVVVMQIAGTLVLRFGGTGRTTRFASIAYIFAAALPTLASNLPLLILATATLGAISGWMDVSMNAHAAAVEKQWGRPIMSSFHAGFSLGGLVGSGFGFLIISAGVPTTLLMPTTAVVVAGIVFVAGPHLGAGDVPRHREGTAFQLPDRTLWALALIAISSFLIEGAMADWSGVYLTIIGTTPAVAASGYAAFSVAMVTGRLLGDRIVRVIGRPAVIRDGAAIAAVGLTLAVLTPKLATVVVGFALVGIGLANVIPSVFSASAARGKTPAAGIAAVSTAGYAGMLGGPPVIGAIASGWSLRTGIAFLAAVAALTVVVSFWNRSTTR